MSKATVVRVTSAAQTEKGRFVVSGDAFAPIMTADASLKPGTLAIHFAAGSVLPSYLAEKLDWDVFKPESFELAQDIVIAHNVVLQQFGAFNVGMMMGEGADVTRVLGVK